MRQGPRRAAGNAAAGALSMLKRRHRPFTANYTEHALGVGGRTDVLPSYESRRALRAAARRQAQLAGGRDRFIWESRVVALGVPLGIAAGVLAWQTGRGGRLRDVTRFAGAFAATVGLTWLEAAAEWRGMEEAGGV